MSFNAKQLPSAANKKRPPALEAGSYPARLVQIILLGIQASRPYKGEEKPPRLTMRTTYELLDEFMKDDEGNDIEDKPRWITEELPFMSLKADLAKSTKRYYALDPEDKADGDWAKLLEAPCMLTIVAEQDSRPGNDTIYNKVSNVSAMRPKEAAKAPPLKNPALIWDFYDPDVEVFKEFPEWLQEKIKSAVDFEGSLLERALSGGTVVKSKPAKTEQKIAEPPAEEEPDQEDW